MISKQSQVPMPLEPSFKAYRSDRTLYPHIQRAFLRNIHISEDDIFNGLIKHEDGSEWVLVITGDLALDYWDRVACLCSFQLWKDGRKWAICRLASSQQAASESEHGQ